MHHGGTGDPLRDAGDLRRRAPADAARVSREVGEKLVERIKWWEDYTAQRRRDEQQPSPGNKAGGLTTILEKSLGAVAKGGTTTLTAVYEYAEPVTAKGFVFMDTPGYDPVGDGPGRRRRQRHVLHHRPRLGFGCKPAPSIKLATNTPMYERMIEDMDINCGEILDGEPVEEMGQGIFDSVLQVASGRRTKSEDLGSATTSSCPGRSAR